VIKQERLKWWTDARFGMMITWGAYSQTGGYWNGVYQGGYSEWLKFREIPNNEYDSLVNAFNPVDFDAEKWVEIAKNAGMKYMVLMAKHHDGLAMYDSPVSDYDILDMTEFGRDPVSELATACHKAGLKFGVYYSVDRDWHHPDAACDDKYKQCNFWDYPENKSGGLDRWHNNYFPNLAVKQIIELVTQYPVDIVWFDGINIKTRAEVALLDSIIHTHRPYCLINSRISHIGSSDGDYGSQGDNETPNGYQAGGWENPGTLGFSYGYSVKDKFMSPEKAVHKLIEIVSKGGNYLLNVGPDGKGVIVPEAVDILQEIGSWLEEYGTSIYGADGLPLVPP
jgi:alpha-L-fucosidase